MSLKIAKFLKVCPSYCRELIQSFSLTSLFVASASIVENVLGTFNGGVGVLMSGLDLERLVLSGGPLGSGLHFQNLFIVRSLTY